MARKIQFKRGKEVDLPQLSEAELGFTTDSKKAFIGSDSGNIGLAKQEDLDAGMASAVKTVNGVAPIDGNVVVTGVEGPSGDDGADGKSAYEIAVDNGFVGDEADWLESLKGKDGTGEGGSSEWDDLKNVPEKVKNIDQELETITSQLADTVKSQRVGGLLPVPLRNVKVEPRGSGDPYVLDIFDGYVWGVIGSNIHRRELEKGSPWQLYTTKGMSAARLLPTSDGEVLLLNSGQGIFKSSNWADPTNLTWTNKVKPNGVSNFLGWGFDGSTTKFIATTYAAADGYADSRYAWVSLDAGETWTIAYDSVAMHGADLANGSHMHAVAYDHYSDRFYISEGHKAEIAGVYVSIDDGVTWRLPEGMRLVPAPTTLTPTPTGLVCGSDNEKNGLFGVVRMDDPMDEEIVQTWSWKTHRDGLIGFAQRGFYEPESGLVYVAFRTNFTDVNPIIAAGTPTSGGFVYEWNSPKLKDSDTIANILLPNKDEVLASAFSGSSNFKISGISSPPGAKETLDTGNIFGGVSSGASSIAAGLNATTSGIHSIALGVGAKASGVQNSTSVGDKSTSGTNATSVGAGATTGANSTAVGNDAKAVGANSVAAGFNASTPQSNSVAVGQAAVSATDSVAMGQSAKNTGTNSTAVGKSAEAGFRAIAIGESAKATHANSVAIGKSVETTIGDQVNLGKKHVVIEKFHSANISGSLPVDSGAFFVRLQPDKLELCFKFSNANTVHVLATSPIVAEP